MVDSSLRLPLLNPSNGSHSVAEIFDLLPEINLFRVMANAGTLFPAYMRFLDRLFRPMELSAILVRMLILHISRRSSCEYAWMQNAIVGRVVGVSNEQIQAIYNNTVTVSCFDEAEVTAFRFVEETMDLIEVSDATFVRAKQFFSDRAIAEMLYIVGAYMFVARVARTARVPLDKTDPATALEAARAMLARHQESVAS